MSQYQSGQFHRRHPGGPCPGFQGLAEGMIAQRPGEPGLLPGARLKVEKLAPLGDPLELVTKGHHLSLRREESRCLPGSEEA
jgi:Fe2+ transport system protein FeoA